MRKVINIFKKNGKTLKVWESSNKLRGVLSDDKSKEVISFADFYYSDGDMDIYRVKEYFNFNDSIPIPFDRKNGKIKLFPVNVNFRVIWTNDDYDEWREQMILDGEKEDELTYERYADDCDINLGDERANLNIDIDGYIVAIGNIGTWQGVVKGRAIIGTNVKDILYSNCDFCTWYCDRYNVRFRGSHHDGNNSYLYRVVETKEAAEKLMEKFGRGGMSEEQFRKATKSLRPYVAKIYGF